MFTGLRIAIGGAGQGIGASCARMLSAQGAHLVLCARSQGDLAALEKELRAARKRSGQPGPAPKLVCIAADLGTDAGADAFARAGHEQLGGLDLALICAGISLRPERLTAPGDARVAERLREQLQGNTLAPALAAIALARAWQGRDASLPALAVDGPGLHAASGVAEDDLARARLLRSERRILVLSSMVTRRPAQPALGPYLAAKSALEALLRTLAEETWPRICVNALCLGPVATRLHVQAGTPAAEMAQFPTADEVAPLVLGLLGTSVRGLSGRCIDAEAFATDPDAALWGDGRLALLSPLQPPPSLSMPDEPARGDDDAPLEPEPGRPPSPRVRAALRATAATLQRYPGDLDRLARRLGELHQVDPDLILLSGGGATALLQRALHAVGHDGDELVSPFPTFEVVSALASRAGLRHRMVPARRTAEGMFEPHRARELLEASGPRTRAVYVASPDNPTGAVLPREEELALRLGLSEQTALIVDEAWTLDVPDEPRVPPPLDSVGTPIMGTQHIGTPIALPGGCPILRLRSLSKLHGLAGLRVGYAIASPGLASLVRRLDLPFPLAAPQIAAALAALDELPRARRVAMLLRRKRARLAEGIRALGLLASEGVSPLILVRDPRPHASAGPLLFALRAARLAAQEAHWDPAALTISVGTTAQDRKVLAALQRGMAK